MTGSPPGTDLLLDWLQDQLPAEQSASLAQAVQDDPALQARVAWLRDFLRASRETVLVDPPPGVLAPVNVHFAAYARQKRGPGLLRTFRAMLTADSWQRLALAGVRDVSLRSAPRQVIYSSALADVALNIQARPGGAQFDLEGQLFALEEGASDDFIVQLLQEGVERRLAFSDTLGKFSLAGLPAGVYELLASSDQGDIEIGPIELA